MATITFPTGSDISIEVNGQRLAVAQSYKARTAKESRYVEAFGSREPVDSPLQKIPQQHRQLAGYGGEGAGAVLGPPAAGSRWGRWTAG